MPNETERLCLRVSYWVHFLAKKNKNTDASKWAREHETPSSCLQLAVL